MSGKEYVYLWADGVHSGVRLEDASQSILVVIAQGGPQEGVVGDERWLRRVGTILEELLLELKQRGLTIDPKAEVGDGALRFWKALPQVFGSTRAQRWWVHKTANVLNKLPKGQREGRLPCTRS